MRGRRRRLALLVLAVVGAAGALAAAGPAPGVEPGDVLPDLVSDSPQGAHLQTYVDSSGTRLLMRFDGYVHNRGPGALEIWGTNPSALEMTRTFQRIYKTAGTSRDDSSKSPWLIYETSDGHNHWHFRAAARYLLYDSTKTAVVAPGQKVGFCLVDSERIETGGPVNRVYFASTFCGQNQPTASQVMMGISAGWRDVYSSSLAFQWVDVSEVQPGTYWLASQADPDDTVVEANESNPIAFATASTTVPGYVAKPLFVTTSANQAASIFLSADAFGSNGALRYRILSAPAHGSLNQPVGVPLTSPGVTYTPAAGYNGPDSFSYVAYDSMSAFPRSPAPATVSIAVGTVTPTVQISGAPGSMTAGTSVQLSATVTGDPPSVTWSVVSAGGGTVSSSGLYTAPSEPPASGSATIRATSARAFDDVTIAIQSTQPPAPAPTSPPPPPPPPPSPAPEPATTPPASTDPTSSAKDKPAKPTADAKIDLLRAPVLARRKRSILISTESGKAGTIEITALKGSSAIGRCVTRSPAGRELTCRVMLEPGAPVKGVRILLRLRSKGELLAYRRATFRKATSYYLGAGLQCWIGPGAANPAALG